jgi:hypothetical protein
MLYKTITLEWLRANRERYRRLRTTRTLLSTLNRLAAELKAGHETWMEHLRQKNPTLDPISLKSAALELALAEWTERLERLSSDDLLAASATDPSAGSATASSEEAADRRVTSPE